MTIIYDVASFLSAKCKRVHRMHATVNKAIVSSKLEPEQKSGLNERGASWSSGSKIERYLVRMLHWPNVNFSESPRHNLTKV